MKVHSVSGTAQQIGAASAEALAEQTLRNLSILVLREGYEPLPREDRGFREWWGGQEGLVRRLWPWMLEEMEAVAGALDVSYEDILLLNLRAWQFEFYGAVSEPAGRACTSVAMTLADGTVATAGAIDDPIDYYCGPVRIEPAEGHRFISFPMAGTSWGSRGLNGLGLSLGISSQFCPAWSARPTPSARIWRRARFSRRAQRHGRCGTSAASIRSP
jgi:hypothetical protein